MKTRQAVTSGGEDAASADALIADATKLALRQLGIQAQEDRVLP